MVLKAWAEAQQAVIGSLLIDPDYVAGEVFQRARPAFFDDQALRHLFEAARTLWDAGTPIDPVTVVHAAGGEYAELVRSCMLSTPTASNVGAWLDICRDSAQLNAMQSEALAIINAEKPADAQQAYERMGALLQDVEDGEDLSITELIGDYLDRMQDKRPVKYLDWGITQLNDRLWVSPGQFIILAADSSVGKTAIALQFAYHMAKTGHRVGFFSLETPKESLEDRLMAEHQVAGIPLPLTKQKRLNEEDYRRAGEAGIRSNEVCLRILRKYDSLERIRAKTLQRRFDVIFIDYVQLIDAPGTERWDVVTRISMGLHRMAQQLGITVVGLSQITPAAKGVKTPTKDDLRESRQLKQDADAILILSPSTDEADPPNTRVLEIAKNKDGQLGRTKLSFDAEHMTFFYATPTVGAMRSEGQAIKNRKPTRAPVSGTDTVPKTKPGQRVDLGDGDGGDLPF